MKYQTMIIIAALAALGSAGSAEDKSGQPAGPRSGSAQAQPMTQCERKVALTVKDYLGVNLVNTRGEPLGKIVDFTLDNPSGKFDRAVVESGGFLGIKATLISVPYAEIQHVPGTRNLVWNVSRTEYQALLNQAKERGKPARAVRTASGTAKGAGGLTDQTSTTPTVAKGQ